MTRTKTIEMLAIWLILLAGCGPAVAPGYVEALQPATTAAGITKAINGAPGTQIFENVSTGMRIYVWPQTGGWGFASICNTGRCHPAELLSLVSGGKGNWVPPREMSDLASHLRLSGWQVVSGASAAAHQTAQSIAIGSIPIIGLLVIPSGIVPSEAYEPQS